MARDPHRIKVTLAILQAVWEETPDMRLGQLIQNAAFRGGWTDNDIFYVEDGTVIKGLTEMTYD